MKSLKSNEIYHNVAILIRWGRYALHEDNYPVSAKIKTSIKIQISYFSGVSSSKSYF